MQSQNRNVSGGDRSSVPVPKKAVLSSSWFALRTILFSNTEERRKGMFMVTLYQETIEHAVDMINGGADAHILLCCVEIVSRILDQRDVLDFDSVLVPPSWSNFYPRFLSKISCQIHVLDFHSFLVQFFSEMESYPVNR